jgi:DNA polymerase-3 subunit delta
MKLKLEQLTKQVSTKLQSIYLIAGDELVLLDEAAFTIWNEAKKQGFSERKLFNVSAQFNWNSIAQETQNLSLFAEKNFIELHFASEKIGKPGSEALQKYAAHVPEDTIILIRAPKLSAAVQKSAWFLALEKSATIVLVWPITANEFPYWLNAKASEYELKLSNKAIQLLSEYTEGNLLAAKQALLKLSLIYKDQVITDKEIKEVLSSDARFNIFELGDIILKNDMAQALKVLNHLKSEELETPIILWAFTKDLRLLIQLSQGVQASGIWKNREGLFQQHVRQHNIATYFQCLQYCADIDAMIKGAKPGDVWQSFEKLILRLTSKKGVAK